MALSPYLPGTAPGQFRGVNPINRYYPSIKPFTLESASQFRVPPPLALTSAQYAADFNETRVLGVATGSTRTEAQTEIARFHTEPSSRFWPRNLRRFAMTDRSLLEHARLMAMLFVGEADAIIACFDSKYFYNTWRPASAIPLADTDGNDATAPDSSWVPVVPTPNHPEYPAAHACVGSAVRLTPNAYYRTDSIEFAFDSTVTGNTHNFTSAQALLDEIRVARIYGGMHFRDSMLKGEELGTQVARRVAARFKPQRSCRNASWTADRDEVLRNACPNHPLVAQGQPGLLCRVEARIRDGRRLRRRCQSRPHRREALGQG